MARSGTVAVIGAGFYGSTTAQRLAEYDVFDTVVLTDIIEGRPEGLALDMNQARPVEGFETKIVGQTTGADGSGYAAIADEWVPIRPGTDGALFMAILRELLVLGLFDREFVARYTNAGQLVNLDDASDALMDQIELTARLIRSKGVGVYFVTQSPTDVPSSVLSQLGNRVQHALRAHTPNDAKALKATVSTFPTNRHCAPTAGGTPRPGTPPIPTSTTWSATSYGT